MKQEIKKIDEESRAELKKLHNHIDTTKKDFEEMVKKTNSKMKTKIERAQLEWTKEQQEGTAQSTFLLQIFNKEQGFQGKLLITQSKESREEVNEMAEQE